MPVSGGRNVLRREPVERIAGRNGLTKICYTEADLKKRGLKGYFVAVVAAAAAVVAAAGAAGLRSVAGVEWSPT